MSQLGEQSNMSKRDACRIKMWVNRCTAPPQKGRVRPAVIRHERKHVANSSNAAVRMVAYQALTSPRSTNHPVQDANSKETVEY